MSLCRWGFITVQVTALWCVTAVVDAQRVHLLAVGDTLDRKIGESVERDLGNVVATFFILLREGQLDFSRVEGDQVTAEGILTSLDRIRLKPDDALVVYWAGHGAFDQAGQYLQMPKGGNLYRATLLGAMKKRQPRLAVLLTDCCNVFSDSTAGKPPLAPASPDPRRKTSPLFEELFLKSRGLVDINAASQGEFAIGVKEGGLFTLSLCYMMPGRSPGADEPVDGGPDQGFGVFWHNSQKRLNWQQVIEEARTQVQQLFSEVNPGGLIARDGKTYRKQTVVAWSLPESPKRLAEQGSRFGVEAVDNNGEGVRIIRVWADYPGTRVTDVDGNKLWQLQPGDVILAINGRRIGGTKDYWGAVKNSPQTMEFSVRDFRDGTQRNLRVQLRY